jgi:hypothetical protein
VRGLVFDVNIQGLFPHFVHLMTAMDLIDIWNDKPLVVRTVADLGYPTDVRDRVIWNRCQADGLVLVTENRTADDADSLQATIADSLTSDSFPVLTLANVQRFRNDRRYALIVADAFLTTVTDTAAGLNRGVGRLYIPPRPVV